MPPRNKPCKGCPQSTVSTPKTKVSPITGKAVEHKSIVITSTEEGQNLWNHILFGTGSCVGMIEGYQKMGLPGDPLPSLIDLRDRLNAVINNNFKVKNGNCTPTERDAPTSESRSPIGQVGYVDGTRSDSQDFQDRTASGRPS